MLAAYEVCVSAQGSTLLQERDAWYRLELPRLLGERSEPHITRQELIRLVEWKMARGIWRARNLHLARSNSDDEVQQASGAAFAAVPDLRSPLKLLGRLKGVGPATASAVLSAYRPDLYPFFDDIVAAQVPGLRIGEFTPKAYVAYAVALRERAELLAAACPHSSWSAQRVGLALWAAAGGKSPSSAVAGSEAVTNPSPA
jgi:hypothetical protein